MKVEADRGEDLGMIVQIFPVPEAGRPLPLTAGQKRGFGQFEKEHIIRAATEEEVSPLSGVSIGAGCLDLSEMSSVCSFARVGCRVK